MTSTFPVFHLGPDQLQEIRGKDNRILLGVTGGVASGKTTVTSMLEQLGAPLIDFDLLSRWVVEPGKPAWKEIVACFGEQVLLEDGTLDRKKLSEVVFRDREERRKLERFIHPRVFEEFIQLVKEVTSKDPNAIIQVDVPLMIEMNLQYLFHKILLVYMSEEMQVERLIKRDRISEEMARNMIRAQLPIEEKRGYADFIVDNSGTPEETRRQVLKIWEKLKEIQRDRSA
jgi:dephospho-CoA kinase